MKAHTFITLAALVGLSSLHASTLQDGLIDHYDFNGSLIDSTGNGFNLTNGGTYEYVQDRFGVYDGAVKLVTANPDNGTFFLGTGPDLANKSSSVSFWVRKDYIGDGTNGSWVFGLGHPAGTGGSLGEDMNVSLDYGQSLRYSFFADDFNSATALSNFVWNHLAFTYDYVTGLRSIYINGVLDSTNYAAFPFTGGTDLKMGFEGITLDDFRLYDRALTGEEARMLAGGRSVPEGGVTALLFGLGVLAVGSSRRLRKNNDRSLVDC